MQNPPKRPNVSLSSALTRSALTLSPHVSPGRPLDDENAPLGASRALNKPAASTAALQAPQANQERAKLAAKLARAAERSAAQADELHALRREKEESEVELRESSPHHIS